MLFYGMLVAGRWFLNPGKPKCRIHLSQRSFSRLIIDVFFDIMLIGLAIGSRRNNFSFNLLAQTSSNPTRSN
jgi:hypothetical protein